MCLPAPPADICRTETEIEKPAEAEGGEIHWGDEAALVNTDVHGRCYAPAGKTRWMILDEAFNSDRLIAYLDALIKQHLRIKKFYGT